MASTGIMGLSIQNGCWLAQVQVHGVRHRRTFGKATQPNALRAIAWLEGLRAKRTAELPAGTAAVVAKGSADAAKRVDKAGRYAQTYAERIATHKKAYAAKKRK